VISDAQYAELLQRLEELEGEQRWVSHIGALRKEIDELKADYFLEVAKGNIPGHSITNKFGRNDAIQNASTYETIWNGGDSYTGHNATAAEKLECFSGGAEDAGTVLSSGTATSGSTTTLIDTGATFATDTVAAGDVLINDTNVDHGIVVSLTGETQINVLRMAGGTTNAASDAYRVATKASTGAPVLKLKNLLDGNFAAVSAEYIVLNGAGVVETVGTYLRCSRGRLHGGIGANGVTARQTTTTANVMMVLPAGYNSTMIAADTVPAGKTGYLFDMFGALSGKTNADAIMRLQAREVGDVFQVQEQWAVQGTGTTHSPRVYTLPKGPYREMTDIFIEASADTNSTGIAAGWAMLLVDN